MTDQTKALLPVTQADRDEAAKFLRGVYGQHGFDSLWAPTIERGAADWHAIVRLVAAVRQSHSLPGDVGKALEIAKSEIRQLGCDPDDIERALSRINRAALTPSLCPGDVGMREAAQRALTILERNLHRQTEKCDDAVSILRAAALTPSALSGDAGEGE